MSTTRSPKRPRKSPDALRRPFAPSVLAKAKTIAHAYQVLIWFENGEYYGRGLELPFTAADGATPQACFENVREAMVGTIAHMLERGDPHPRPVSDAERTEEISVRLSVPEKLRAEEAARASGYRGLADYLRARAVSED